MPGFLDNLRQKLGWRTVPDDLGTLFARARNEREALALLEQARAQDEQRLVRAMQDLDVLGRKEQELLNEGRAEAAEVRRMMLARLLREVRARAREINQRVETIYQKRLQIYGEHIASLRTIVELEGMPLPDGAQLENAAIRARERIEQLDRGVATAQAIGATAPVPVISEEERAILAEFAAPTAAPALPQAATPCDPAAALPEARPAPASDASAREPHRERERG